jgi:hypothetical protein
MVAAMTDLTTEQLSEQLTATTAAVNGFRDELAQMQALAESAHTPYEEPTFDDELSFEPDFEPYETRFANDLVASQSGSRFRRSTRRRWRSKVSPSSRRPSPTGPPSRNVFWLRPRRTRRRSPGRFPPVIPRWLRRRWPRRSRRSRRPTATVR